MMVVELSNRRDERSQRRRGRADATVTTFVDLSNVAENRALASHTPNRRLVLTGYRATIGAWRYARRAGIGVIAEFYLSGRKRFVAGMMNHQTRNIHFRCLQRFAPCFGFYPL